MKFKSPKVLVSEKLISEGIRRPKLLFNPGRGDFFNRLSYRLIKGEYGVLRSDEFDEPIRPGKVVDRCCGVELLAFKGDVEPDAAVVRRPGSLDFSEIDFKYPDFAVDMSLFKRLLPSERKSLMVQLEIAYGTVKDFFTPENFFVFNVPPEGKVFMEEFFSPQVPFPVKEEVSGYSQVIVLDPNGEEEFTHEEVDENTLIVVGGIVDSSQRLKGSTRELLPSFKHRRITYKGIVSIVPDRINEVIKIVADYLTSPDDLYTAVKRNLTRDSKLRFLREFLENNLVRFLYRGELLRGLPESKFLWLKEEFDLTDFFFRKAAKHVSGFFVFKETLFGKVKGETVKRKKRVFILGELTDEDVVAKYP